MKGSKIYAFLLGLLAGALSTWFQPYNELEIFGVDYRIIMAVAAVIFSFLFRLFSQAGTTTAALFIAYGILSALVLRIVVDVIRDPTDHNLWPLEVAIFVVIAFPATFIGAYLAELIHWTKKRI